MLSDSVKDIVGKTIAIPSNVLASMQTEVNRQLALNVPLVTAVQFALSKYSNSIPEVSAAKNASKVEAELNQSKIDLNKATADAKLITANAATTKAQKS
jgi:hypothetical protein